MVNYNERIEIKITKGERFLAWNSGETNASFPVSVNSQGQQLNLPVIVCDKYKMLSTRAADLSLDVHSFYWESVVQANTDQGVPI